MSGPLRQYEAAVRKRDEAATVLEQIGQGRIPQGTYTVLGLWKAQLEARYAYLTARDEVRRAVLRLILAALAWATLASVVVATVWVLIVLFAAAADSAAAYFPGIIL